MIWGENNCCLDYVNCQCFFPKWRKCYICSSVIVIGKWSNHLWVYIKWTEWQLWSISLQRLQFVSLASLFHGLCLDWNAIIKYVFPYDGEHIQQHVNTSGPHPVRRIGVIRMSEAQAHTSVIASNHAVSPWDVTQNNTKHCCVCVFYSSAVYIY